MHCAIGMLHGMHSDDRDLGKLWLAASQFENFRGSLVWKIKCGEYEVKAMSVHFGKGIGGAGRLRD